MSGKSSASFFPHPGPPKARTNQTGDQPKVRVSTQGQAVDDPRPKTPVPAGSDFCPAPLQCRRRRRRPWRPPLAELPEGATRPTVVAGQRPLICQFAGNFLGFFFHTKHISHDASMGLVYLPHLRYQSHGSVMGPNLQRNPALKRSQCRKAATFSG